MTKLLRFISEEESDGGTGNALVDKVFTNFLNFSSFGIRALEISAMLVFQMFSLMSFRERNRNYGFKRETQSIHEILILPAFPEDLANNFGSEIHVLYHICFGLWPLSQQRHFS